MSDIIKLLPDSVANQIAAGEVIQRPSSVIKELVENSIDAGATDIQIIIKDAGRTLIQVVDNGIGMSPTDARMAFERHATSKIREAADLFSLHSMGFRGEALPSICAISQVELKSKREADQIGTHLIINASKAESQKPATCDSGTNIMVKNLFFNVPARRKFLKSDNVELSNIIREFERLALVNNAVRMRLDTGNKVIDLKPSSFHKRIEDIWKNVLDLHLIPIEVDTALVKISGYISRPEYARRRNPLQYLIVNGRNMKHPYFHKAIVGCYDSLIAPDTQPCYFLKFTVAPESIDVNIHPTKNEIKFEHEQEIWPILQASVKAALGKFGAVPSIDFNLDVVPIVPVKQGETPVEPKISVPQDYNPFRGTAIGHNPQYAYGMQESKSRPDSNWDKLYADFMRNARGFGDENKSENKDIKSDTPSLIDDLDMRFAHNICLQFNERYIITTTREGIMVVDQRRAHIKILYEEFLRHLKAENPSSLGLVFPESIEIEANHQDAFEEILPELVKVGFRLEYESDLRWNITGIPAFIKNIDVRDVVMKMVEGVDDSDVNYGKSGKDTAVLLNNLAHVLAKSAAINYGQKLSPEEMEHIVSRLFTLQDSSYDPVGNRIYYLIDKNYINNIFH